MEIKIGIVSWFNYANPGSAFQAYALQRFINNFPSCDAEFVNILNPLTALLSAPILKYYAKKHGCLYLPIRLYLALKAYGYCSFQRANIKKYPSIPIIKYPLSKKNSRLINQRYDWVILGSDQLWNFGLSTTFNFDERRFLSFVSGPQKGAYAPSIGKEDWPEQCKLRIKELLSDFSFIGVREKQSIGVVQPLVRVPVHWSLDPTFLLDKTDWSKIAKKTNYEGEYIFEYCIIKSSLLRAITEKLSEMTGLPIIESHGDISKHVPSAQKMPHPSPETWLGYLMNARYVVTDSFHGCAFSINTNKDFYTAVTINGSRIYSILEMFDLQDRALKSADDIDISKTINWDKVNIRLEDRRKESQNWLKSSLLK